MEPSPSRARLLLSSAVIVCLGIPGCATTRGRGLTLPELIRRHTEARGGQAAIGAIRTLEAKLRIVEPSYTAEGLWRVDRRGRMRIDVTIDGRRVWTEAYDGKGGWQLPGGEERAVPSVAGAAALRHSGQLPTNILGLHEMAGHGHRLDYAGREEIGGVLYHVVVLTLDDGFVTRYYLDPSSLLIARARVRKALHPDLDPTETTIETVWTDVRQVAGVPFAFQANDTDLATGKLLQTTTLLDLQANRPIDDSLFLMPGTAAGPTNGAAS